MKGMRAVWVLIAAVAWLAPRSGAAPGDRAELLQGVQQIAAPGSPGTVAVFGTEAVVVVAGKLDGDSSAPVIAASRLGQGRIVAFGHDGYFDRAALRVGDTGQLMQNAVRWLSAGRNRRQVGVVQKAPLLAFLRGAGIPASPADPGGDLSAYGVLALTHDALTGDIPERVRTWVQRGGGLLIASTGWGWSQITGLPLSEHPGNRILAPAGLAYGSGLLRSGGRRGLSAAGEPDALLHGEQALAALRSRRALSPAEAGQAVDTCLLAVRCVPAGSTEFPNRVKQLGNAGGEVVPTEAQPVRAADAVRRLALAVITDEALRSPAAETRAAPAAREFPGPVPENAPRVRRTITVDPSAPGWSSTGLYAAPGERVRFTFPAGAPQGWAIRIGAHSDELWHLRQWKRAPEVTRVVPVGARATEVASGFGGLLYVVVPDGATGGPMQVSVDGAVEAPYFRLGQTTPAQWRQTIRNHPAPWAELAGNRVVLTVPSRAIRALERPAALMQLWDRIVEVQDNLAALPPRKRLERIVSDVQISAGYMHSGYPIMTPTDDSMTVALTEARLRAEGSWGHFHEVGHNHQHEDWTFDGTGEVTCNLFAMYVTEKVLGQQFHSGHPNLKDRAQIMAAARQHMQKGAPFEEWKNSPFLALTMYIQLIEGFGWAPFEQLFREYRTLPEDQRPKTDDARRDQWLTRFSRTVGRNLGPFFQQWGVPTSEAARQALRDLPAWSPRP